MYYGWPLYWGNTYIGPANAPANLAAATARHHAVEPEEKECESNLRSIKEIKGYRIHALDGDIGHVSDCIVDTSSWALRYLAVDTGHWLPGKKVLIAPRWVEYVHWDEAAVGVRMQREEVRNSPPYDPEEPVNREYEERLYDYYGRPKYWE